MRYDKQRNEKFKKESRGRHQASKFSDYRGSQDICANGSL
jgi:hypothetical protein